MPTITLDTIITSTRRRVTQQQKVVSLKKLQAAVVEQPASTFVDSLTADIGVALIAEYKTASPSHGVLSSASLESTVTQYDSAGASAISILTEPEFFNGQLEYVTEARNLTNLPLLRKDFIVDAYQIYESAVAQADAILLIATALSVDELQRFSSLAHQLQMDVLFEAHTGEDIQKIMQCGLTEADAVGINSRDLTTMHINLATFTELVDQLPTDATVVAESGIVTLNDVRLVAAHGADAMLVGSSIMQSADPAATIHNLLTAAR